MKHGSISPIMGMTNEDYEWTLVNSHLCNTQLEVTLEAKPNKTLCCGQRMSRHGDSEFKHGHETYIDTYTCGVCGNTKVM